MSNFEQIPFREIIPSKREIDTWLFLEHKLSILHYLIGLSGDEIDEENLSILEDKLAVDPNLYRKFLDFIKKKCMQFPEDERLSELQEKMKQLPQPPSTKEFYELYYDSIMLRNLLQDYHIGIAKNISILSKIISPYDACLAVKMKFFQKQKTEILFDQKKQKCLLLIYGKKGRKNTLTLYDPLGSLSRIEDVIPFEEDPNESFEREYQFRHNNSREIELDETVVG